MKAQQKVWGLILLVAALAFALYLIRRIYSPTGERGFGVAQLRRPAISPEAGSSPEATAKPSPSVAAEPTQVAKDSDGQAAAGQTAGGGGGQTAAAPTSASDTQPPALDPAQRTFVVDSEMTVVANGQECALSPGDVITRVTDTPDADQNVNANVSSAKKGDCASGQTVAVKVDDLQEMYNHFQENVANGGERPKTQVTGIPKHDAAPAGIDERPANPAPATDNRPGQFQLEAGVRLWIRVSNINRKSDGSFTLSGTLLQPVLAGAFELDQKTELTAYGMVNNGHVTIRITEFSSRGANYTLQDTGRSSRPPGTGPAVEITPGKLFELWLGSNSVYKKTP